MNFLRNYLDKQKPKFEKGGKLEKFHSVFTGFESFLFVPNTTTSSGAHIRDAVDLKRTMIIVVLALIPALLFGIYNVGYQHFNAVGGPGRHHFLPTVLLRFVESAPHDHRILCRWIGHRICSRPNEGT